MPARPHNPAMTMKQYIKPEMTVLEVGIQNMMAASPLNGSTLGGPSSGDNQPEIDNPSSILSKDNDGTDLWDEAE